MSLQTASLDRYERPTGRSAISAPLTGQDSATGTRHASLRRSEKDYSFPGDATISSVSNMTVQSDQALETSLQVLIWNPNATASLSSALSRTPILRDVPQVKRKLARRDRDTGFAPGAGYTAGSPIGGTASIDSFTSATTNSSSLPAFVGSPPGSGSSTGSILTGPSDYRSFVKSAAPSWLREKPSKSRLAANTPVALPHSLPGAWRRGTLTCRETGVLLLYGEDNSLLHSLSAVHFHANDIRIVDDSLFNRPNVLGLFARPSTFTANSRGSPLPNRPSSGSVSQATAKKDEPIFICFPTLQKMLRWRSLLRTYAIPEIYGSVGSDSRDGTHRMYRQIDLTIVEAKIYAECSPSHERLRRRSSAMGPLPQDDNNDAPSNSHGLANTPTTPIGAPALHARRTSDTSALRALSSVDESQEAHGSRLGGQEIFEPGENECDEPYSPPIAPFRHAEFSSSSAETDGRNSHYYFGAPAQLQSASCFCQIWRAGQIVARTKASNGVPTIAWFDKFCLRDLPLLLPIHVEVLQSWRNGKGYATVGVVDLPLQTMRRGEAVEGWFPIWAQVRTEEGWSRYSESTAPYARELVGEIKLSLNVIEEYVLASKRYADVHAALNGPDCIPLMHRLCKELDEDRMISHLVDVFAAGGTIADRLADLTVAESSTFADEPTLLFRGNTLLSRALDKYQRRYCVDWLDACVGPSIRRVCSEQILIEPGRGALSAFSAASQTASSSSSEDSDDPNAETLKRLCHELWVNIYACRHNCPPELRKALQVIRTTVNAKYHSSPGPGVQGVGAFVFLRLICPAITTPNLYGLMGSAPEGGCARTLMLVAKVFLALASKRYCFNRDKEPWLTRLDDFLQRQANAYDDFITTISTPLEQSTRPEPLGDEADTPFQTAILHRVAQLPTLQREAVPTSGVAYDHTLALASLVSYVVRNAPNVAQGETSEESLDSNAHAGANLADVETKAGPQTKPTTRKDDFGRFVDICCDVEDLAGYYIDRAGFCPEPIQITPLQQYNAGVKTTSIYAANQRPQTAQDDNLSSSDQVQRDAVPRLENASASAAQAATKPSRRPARPRSATTSSSYQKTRTPRPADVATSRDDDALASPSRQARNPEGTQRHAVGTAKTGLSQLPEEHQNHIRGQEARARGFFTPDEHSNHSSTAAHASSSDYMYSGSSLDDSPMTATAAQTRSDELYNSQRAAAINPPSTPSRSQAPAAAEPKSKRWWRRKL